MRYAYQVAAVRAAERALMDLVPEGALMRRLVRARLREASAALEGVEASVKGVGFVAIYEYAEYENVGSFVKSLSPSAYAGLPLIAVVVDGEVRPIFVPRI